MRIPDFCKHQNEICSCLKNCDKFRHVEEQDPRRVPAATAQGLILVGIFVALALVGVCLAKASQANHMTRPDDPCPICGKPMNERGDYNKHQQWLDNRNGEIQEIPTEY